METTAFVIGTSGLIAVFDKIFTLARVVNDYKKFPKDMEALAIDISYEKEKAKVYSEYFLSQQRNQQQATDQGNNYLHEVVRELISDCSNRLLDSLNALIDLEVLYIPESEDIGRSATTSAGVHQNKSKFNMKDKILGVTKPWGQSHKEELEAALTKVRHCNGELISLVRQQDQANSDMKLQLFASFIADYQNDMVALEHMTTPKAVLDDEIRKSATLSLQVIKSQEAASVETKHMWYKDGLDEMPKDTSCLVEWLDCSDLTADQLQIASGRINSLCVLLNSAKPKNLRTLKPLGYGFNNARKGYEIVLEVPDSLRPMENLNKVLGSCLPPLDKRFSLARHLCRSFLELHKSNWLHRGFNSTCVNVHVTSNNEIEHFAALTGFQYARPMGAAQISLPIVQNQGMLTSYHHPEIRDNHTPNTKGPYVRYGNKHDIYSLGVVLLEIGMWKTLSDMMKLAKLRDKTASRRTVLQIAKKYLPHTMGTTYWQVVNCCLGGNEEDEDIPEVWSPKLMVNYIVAPMGNCHCKPDAY